MEKYITFYPQNFESEKHYGRNALQIVYSYREYSSCAETFAPVFQWYRKKLRAPFEVTNFHSLVLLYLPTFIQD